MHKVHWGLVNTFPLPVTWIVKENVMCTYVYYVKVNRIFTLKFWLCALFCLVYANHFDVSINKTA